MLSTELESHKREPCCKSVPLSPSPWPKAESLSAARLWDAGSPWKPKGIKEEVHSHPAHLEAHADLHQGISKRNVLLVRSTCTYITITSNYYVEKEMHRGIGYRSYWGKHSWPWTKVPPLTNATLTQNYTLSDTLRSEITSTRKVLCKSTARKEQISTSSHSQMNC